MPNRRADQSGLAVDAAADSLLRYQLAQELAESCPAELGQEIALVGSAARGDAGADSEVEIEFWSLTVPSLRARLDWVIAIGATDISVAADPADEAAHWFNFRYRGVWIAARWRRIDSLVESLQAILGGRIVDHARLIAAWAVAHAVPLRSLGLIGRLQAELAAYPQVVQARVIESATGPWSLPSVIDTRWSLARRRERLALADHLVDDVHNALRVLFAINRRWEPDWKWLRASAADLSVQPPRLFERIDGALTAAELESAVETSLTLVLETLHLVQPPLDVRRARNTVQASLDARPA
jgi:hypothetical protein